MIPTEAAFAALLGTQPVRRHPDLSSDPAAPLAQALCEKLQQGHDV